MFTNTCDFKLRLKCIECNEYLGDYQPHLSEYKCSSCHKTYYTIDGILDFIGNLDKEGDTYINYEKISSFAGTERDLDFNEYGRRLDIFFTDIETSLSLDCNSYPDRLSLLLEVGCGYGALLAPAALRSDLVVGINIDIEELRKCSKLLQEKGISNVILIRASAQNLPFMPAQFPYVSCVQVMEHVYSPEILLSQIKLMLKPSGRFYLSVPNRFALHPDNHTHLPFIGFLPKILGRQYARFMDKSFEYESIHWFSSKNVENLISREFNSQYRLVRSGVHRSFLGRMAMRFWEAPGLSVLVRWIVGDIEVIAWN